MLRYYRSYSLFRRSLNVLAIGIVLTVLILAVALSEVYSSAMLGEISAQEQHTAITMTGNIERLRDDMMAITAYLGNDNANINTMMFQSEHDRLREYAGHLTMRQLHSTYPHIAFLAVYNSEMDTLSSTVSFQEDSIRLLKARLQERYFSQGYGGFDLLDLRKRVIRGSNDRLPSLAFYFYSPLSQPDSLGAVVVGLDCAYVQSLIGSLVDVSDQRVLLVNENGVVISHPDSRQILADYSNQPYIRDILAAPESVGHFESTVDGERLLVTYARSQYGWSYVSLLPYHSLLQRISSWRNITVGVCLAVLCLAVIYALLGARHTFRPIEHLIPSAPAPAKGQTGRRRSDADIDFLTGQISDYRRQRENQRLLEADLVRQWLTRELPPERQALVADFVGALPREPLQLVLLSLDRTLAYNALGDVQQRGLGAALRDFCLQALKELGLPGTAVPMGVGRTALVFPRRQVEAAALREALERALEDFFKHFSLTCCAALSPVVSHIDNLPEAYETAADILVDRYYDSARATAVLEEKHRRLQTVHYDFRWENALWLAISAGDPEAIRAGVEDFITALRCCPPEYARLHIHQLLQNLLANRLAQRLIEAPVGPYETIAAILNLGTLDLISEELRRFLGQLAFERAAQAEAAPQSRILDQSLALLKTGYMDPAFSVSTAADALKLSPSYFNRLFKKETGASFSAYLNDYRLDQVCRLLVTTQDGFSQICEATGLGNESYCYTLFKKKYGITPSQYRARQAALPPAQEDAEHPGET